jgi:TolB protein
MLFVLFAAACGEVSSPGNSGGSARTNGLIAFASEDDLFVMNPDGSGVRRLTRSGDEEDAFPAWSPNGKEVAFLRGKNFDLYGEPPDRADVYVVKASGGPPTRLTGGLSTVNFSWSPDGRRIAYAARSINGPSLSRIYVMNADGSGKRALTPDTLGADTPAWSPDGRRIAFLVASLTVDGVDDDVYVMNADGTDRTKVTRRMLADSVAWAPDARRIAFKDINRQTVFVVNADGSGSRQLTHLGQAKGDHSIGHYFGPYWSPDGKRIAFVGGGDQVNVVNADGSGQRAVTKAMDFSRGLAWSPDGKRIAYVVVRFLSKPSESDIHVVNADGSGDRRLTHSGAEEVGVSWQPLLQG